MTALRRFRIRFWDCLFRTFLRWADFAWDRRHKAWQGQWQDEPEPLFV